MSISRRNFLKGAVAISVGFSGLSKLMASSALSQAPLRRALGYGELVPDPKGVFDLPEGFIYKIISRSGDTMSDGFIVPGLPDGMAAFPGENGRTILIRNHEVNPTSDNSLGAFGADNELLDRLDKKWFYDYARGKRPALGGTTTLVINNETGEKESEFLSLAGTLRNCAGGPTPWNTWVTCEETVITKDDIYEHDHGYVFEVPASMNPSLAEPYPIKAMGRFNHEAIAVDPHSSVVYLTEDVGDGLLYRFIPNEKQNLRSGGKLQALAVKGIKGLDTRNWEEATVTPGKKMEVEWIDLSDIEAPKDDLRYRGHSDGAARFARGEGMWYGNNAVYFACTNGGKIKKGQIFKYVPSIYEGTPAEKEKPGQLELFIESPSADLIENADNITVAPNGDLVICEDGPGTQYLDIVTPAGEIFKFAKNALNDKELCGCCFSPDGQWLFVNIQNPGITLAITGPWDYI
jgi:secreted PhoX family phosphatase